MQPINDCFKLPVTIIIVVGVVALLTDGVDLLNGVAEDEDVIFADFFANLHVRAIERADSECAIEGELHVARTRSFLTCGRDLLGEVGGGNHLLGHRDAVVLREYDLDLTVDTGIVIYLLTHFIDCTDNVFSQCVARSCLGAKDKNTRIHLVVWIVEQSAIECQNMQQIEVLALILM